MTTQPSNDDKCREAFERIYSLKNHPAAERHDCGTYIDRHTQIAWTNFRYGWLAKERAND